MSMFDIKIKRKMTFKRAFKICLNKGHIPVKIGDILGVHDQTPVEQIVELPGRGGRKMIHRFCLRCGTTYWNWLKEQPSYPPQLTKEQIAEIIEKHTTKENMNGKEESDEHSEDGKPS